ncbi:hypothetical protein PO78_4390 [Thauera sp. SWB20]|nr:hypothetical protein PO78_4390 [Thauera sp. SWB20]
MAGDVGISPFQCVDEAHRNRRGGLFEVVGYDGVDVPFCLFTRNDGLQLHPQDTDLPALCIRPRRLSK